MILFVIFCLKFLSLRLAAAENSIALNYPFLVRIYFKHATQEDSHCGGVIVDKDLILTSAQCCTVVGDAYVVYGDTNHTDYVNRKNMDRYHEWGVAGKMLHDGYQELPDGAHVHDVCLMKLDKELPDDDGHTVIGLPSEQLSTVTNCIVPGWGNLLNDTMQHVLEVETVFPKECQDGSSLCVRLEANCRGDGGNPIICHESTGKRIVCGVDSYYLYAAGSDMTCDDIEANYFVNLYKEKDFLRRHVRSAPQSVVVLTEGEPDRGEDLGKETWKWTEITTARNADGEEGISTVIITEGGQDLGKETGKWTEITTARNADGEEGISTVIITEGGQDLGKETGKWTDITTVKNADGEGISTVTITEGGQDLGKETGKWTDITTVKNADGEGISTVIITEGGQDLGKETGEWTDITTARGVDILEFSTVDKLDWSTVDDKEKATEYESVESTVKISETSPPLKLGQQENMSLLMTTNGAGGDLKEQLVGITGKGAEQATYEEELTKSTEADEHKTTVKQQITSGKKVGNGTLEELEGLTGKDWSETRLTTISTKEKATENLGKDIYQKDTDEPFVQGTESNTEKILPGTVPNEAGKETEVGSDAGPVEVSGKPDEGSGNESTFGEETEKNLVEVSRTTKSYITEDEAFERETHGTLSHEGRTKVTEEVGTEKSPLRPEEPSIEEETNDYGHLSTFVSDMVFGKGTNAPVTSSKGLLVGSGEVSEVKSTIFGSEVEVSATALQVHGEGTEKAPPQSSDVVEHNEYKTTPGVQAKETGSEFGGYDEGSGQFSGDGSGNIPEKNSARTTEKKLDKTTIKEEGKVTEKVEYDYDGATRGESDKDWKETTTVIAKTSNKPKMTSKQETTVIEHETVIWQNTAGTEKATAFESKEPENEELPRVTPKGIGDGSGDQSGVGSVEETETGSEDGLGIEEEPGTEYGSQEGSGVRPEDGSFESTEMEISRATTKEKEKATENFPQEPDGYTELSHTEGSGSKLEEHVTRATKKRWKISTVISREDDTEEIPVEYDEDIQQSYTEEFGTQVSTKKPHSRGTTRKKWRITTAKVKGEGTENTPDEYGEYGEQLYTEGSGNTQKLHSRGTTRKKWRITTLKARQEGTENISDEYGEYGEQSYTEGSGNTQKLHSRGTTRKKWRITTAKVKGEGTENIPDEHDLYTVEGTGGGLKQTTAIGKFFMKPKRPLQLKTTKRSHGEKQGKGIQSGIGSSTGSGEEHGSGGFEYENEGEYDGDSFDEEVHMETRGTTKKKGKNWLLWSIATGKQTNVPLEAGTTVTVTPRWKFHEAHIITSGTRLSTKIHVKGSAIAPEHTSSGEDFWMSPSFTPEVKKISGGNARTTLAASISESVRGSSAKPGGDKPGGDKPGGDKPGGDKPGGDKPGGDKPGGGKPGGGKPGGRGPLRSPSAKARAMIRYEQYYDEDELKRYSRTHKFSPNYFIIFVASVLFCIT